MNILPIKIYGNAVLREKAAPVAEITDELLALIGSMRDSLYYHQGIGLAANQVGVARRLFLVDEGKGLRVFINPRILESNGEAVSEEGCLSLPEIFVDVNRSPSLLLEYLDEKGETRRLEAEGLLARVIQHECDHLEGVLISDRAGFLASRMIKGKLKRLRKRVRESL
ncbi:MAG: peptide deformylase [PVC group bacterium]